MHTNEDNYNSNSDVLKNEFLCKNLNLKQKVVNNLNDNKSHNFSLNNNNDISNREVKNEKSHQNVRKHYEYFEFNDKNGFICKYEDCEQIEISEHSMVSHVYKHLTRDESDKNKSQVIESLESLEGLEGLQSHDLTPDSCQSSVYYKDIKEENECKMKANKSQNKRSSDRIANNNKTAVYVCDWKGCNKSFTYWAPFESHKSEHLVQEYLKNDRKSSQKYSPKERDFDDSEKYMKVMIKNDKEVFVCKWKRCHFKCDSRKAILLHIRSEHLNDNFYTPICNRNQSLNGSNGRHDSNVSEISPKTPTIKRESIEGIEVSHNNNVNISLNINDNNNVFLSCKGLQAANKVEKYFEKKVVDGVKTYFCKWNRCEFYTKRSQEIASHINITHIGLRFRCEKPNCFKIFRTPLTFREHQKNHICGFGIWGYGKNVVGVCTMDNINKYNQKIIINGKRSFRCSYNGCGAVLSHRCGIKRHIHNQHICPHRINSKQTNNQIHNVVKTEPISQDLNSESNASIINKKMFECKQYECKNTKSTHSLQKIKKQNNFYDIQKMEKHRNQTTAQSVDYSETNKSNKHIKSETHQIISGQQSNQINKNSCIDWSQSMTNVNKYFRTESFKGQNYHLCQWNDCKFTTKFENKIVQHIQEQHLGYELQSNCFHEVISTQSLGKRKHSIHESQDNKYQKIDLNNKIKTEVNQSFEKDFKSPTNDREVQNKDNLIQYIDKKCIDGEPNYFCKWNDCKYYENSLDRITEHINETHIRFTCDIHNCLKSFKNEDILRAHKINHICGFGIKGRKSFGVCDLDNISKYLNEQRVGDEYVYSCKWNKCVFVNKNRGIALSHVHNRHICPNRQMSKVKLIQRSETNDSSKAATNHSLVNQKQYTCKPFKCEQKLNTSSDLLKHENILCQFKNYDKLNVKNEEIPRDRNEGRKQSLTESLNESTPMKKNSTQIIGSYGTETSVDNFKRKYNSTHKKTLQ